MIGSKTLPKTRVAFCVRRRSDGTWQAACRTCGMDVRFPEDDYDAAVIQTTSHNCPKRRKGK